MMVALSRCWTVVAIMLMRRGVVSFHARAIGRRGARGATTVQVPSFVIRSQLASSPLSTAASAPASDDSAFSKSRAPFAMPKDSPDDSKPVTQQDLAWNQLGLWTELVDAVRNEMELAAPTPVQQLVIPHLLQPTRQQHTAFLAATGSGKTLAYVLPILQQLKNTEVFENGGGSGEIFERRPKRPRAVIVAPTRELITQITTVVKQLCHSIKLSSCSLAGGEDYGVQRRRLDRPLDVVVATPGRLLKHWKDQNVFLGNLEYVVIDEMDTMIEQGFAGDLRQFLYPVLYHKKAEQPVDVNVDLDEKGPLVIMTSATMTKTIQKIIGDQDSSGTVTAKKLYRKVSEEPAKIALPKMKVLKAPGLHKVVPRLKQVFVDVGSADKMSLLVDVVSSGGSGAAVASGKLDSNALTMIFCNTAASCRAVQYALAEARIETLVCHGELNSAMRTENLQRFRQAGEHPEETDIPRILVCTDIAARGLDIPQCDHVIMFDFPLNALDYLHRSGRTARGVGGERQGNGRVTALVAKRDKVLANAIEQAVREGQPLDGLSSRKSDYAPGTQRADSKSSPRKSSEGRLRSSADSRSKSVSNRKEGKTSTGSPRSPKKGSNSGRR